MEFEVSLLYSVESVVIGACSDKYEWHKSSQSIYLKYILLFKSLWNNATLDDVTTQ
jgi:hypothetical protein